jgi:hypothetical protein
MARRSSAAAGVIVLQARVERSRFSALASSDRFQADRTHRATPAKYFSA